MEAGMDAYLAQMEEALPDMLSELLPSVSEEDEEAQGDEFEQVIESQRRMIERFRQLVPQRINLDQLITEIYDPLYDRYFTAEELRELVAFYNSPTGKKAVTVTPQLMTQAMEQTNRFVAPTLRQLVQEFAAAERTRLMKRQRLTTPRWSGSSQANASMR